MAPLTVVPAPAVFAPMPIDNLPRTGSIARFDPTLGTLISVRITATADLTSSFYAENLSSSTPQSVVGSVSGSFTLAAPGLSSPTAPFQTVTTGAPRQLGVFDGDQDFCGPDTLVVDSNFDPASCPDNPVPTENILPSLTSSASTGAITLTDPAVLALFTGAGSAEVGFTTNAEASVEGDTGNLDTLFTTTAGARIEVVYEYEPPALCLTVTPQVSGYHMQPTTIQYAFSGELDAAAATDAASYGIVWAGADRKPGTRDDRTIGVASVSYDPATRVVTVMPAERLGLGKVYVLTISGAVAGEGNGLLNADGVCGDYSTVLERGTHLRYQDVDGDVVTLGATSGGLMQLYSTPGVGAQRLQVDALPNARSPRVMVRGSVLRRPGGDGTARIGQVVASERVRINLAQPPFKIGSIGTAPIASLARLSALGLSHRRS
jgi:hypothetical protein